MNVAGAIGFFLRECIRFVSPPAVAAEWVLVLLGVLAVAVWGAPFARAGRGARRIFREVAARRRLAILICGLLPAALRFGLSGVIPVPDPSIHDEFSHLLLGDTLAHGRLANATHPLWKHFETIHVIQQPTYSSMYPPVQGMFLGLGEWLFGEPWVGVVISVCLMCAATCWMLQGWLPPAWALFGTLLLIFKIGVQGFWMNSYLGGSAPAIGGALLVGALPRLFKPPFRAGDAAWAALGVVILANSRPFDGAVLSVAVLLFLIPALRRQWRLARMATLRRVLLPAAAVLLAGGMGTGYYCWRVTGSPTRLPYQVNRDTYGWPENLGFLPAKKLTLRHASLQAMYEKELKHREIYTSPDRFLENLTTRAFDNWTYLIGPLLTVPLVFLPGVARGRARPLAILLGLILFLNLFQMVLYPYHLGGVVPCLFGLIAQSCRSLYIRLQKGRRGRGVAFACVLPVALILLGAMKQEARALDLPLAYWEVAREPHGEARAELVEWLSARPRPQLVIVRYAAKHLPDQEWVYNGADIDGSKVVWAREMDPESNKRLLEYFRGREAWLFQADEVPARVVPYPGGGGEG